MKNINIKNSIKTQKKWSFREDKFLRYNYVKYEYPKLAKLMHRSKSSINNRLHKLNLKLPKEIFEKRAKDSQFPKNHIPFNKGIKGIHFSPATEFKKGNKPATEKYDGCISIRQGHSERNEPAYKYIRLGRGRWKALHAYNWEKIHGKVLKGNIIVFKNGDTMNCDVSNLEMITREQHVFRNSRNHNSDGFIAAQMTHKQPELRKILKHMSEIIEIKRLKNKLNKELKNAKPTKKAG